MAVAYGFADLSPLEIPTRYTTVYLYAWSFGVTAAEQTLDPARISEAFAISGTPEGIGETGIPTPVFTATRDNLTPASLAKFRKRMLHGLQREISSQLLSRLDSEPDIESLKADLTAIERCPKRRSIRWRRAYIGENDLIIPSSAQSAAWEDHWSSPSVIRLDAGHFIDLQEVIDDTVPDIENTARNFCSAHTSYRAQASSQSYFALRLLGALESEKTLRPASILEIGNGAGTLSRLLSWLWPKAEATYIDLYPISPGGFFAKETQITGDAEKWLEQAEGRWDLITSSSAIQWFANPERFFANAARLLAPGGVSACSVYSTGNLRELDAVRVPPLHYHSSAELKEMALRWFDDVKVAEEECVMNFGNAREALLHLRDTGVKGRSKAPLADILKSLKEGKLTYKATRLICRLNKI